MSGVDFSVVVPAHQEAAVIGRCLRAFLPWQGPGQVEVVVVANGCSDGTAQQAAQVPGVRVAELPEGSKRAALNLGDSLVASLPRVYLDADIVLGADALAALVVALDTDRAVVAAPAPRFVLDGRPWSVQAFYRIYQRLPYVSDGLVGLGVIGISAAGRARFGEFPAATADDLFVQRLFSSTERLVLREHSFDLETPRSLQSLVVVRTRTAQGNAQLAATNPGDRDFALSTGETMRALVALVVREPRLAPAAVVYAMVTAAARRRANRTDSVWHRDVTTR